MAAHLFTPLKIGGLELVNRIMLSPMCQYSAEDGVPNDWHFVHLGRYAAAGLGLIMVEATHVSARGRITPGCLGLWNDAQEAALARIVGHLKRYGRTPVAIQLAHAGRKASTAVPWQGGKPLDGPIAWTTEAPSAVPVEEGAPVPEALDAAGLDRIEAEFVSAARRAVRAGFDAIELHAAHGYLLHEFLSPVSNRRTDDWGGDAERRRRYPLRVLAAVRAALPDRIPVGVRISATDWLGAEGFEPPEAIEFARAARDLGCAFVDVSSGGISPRQRVVTGPGYQVPFAAAVKAATGLPTIAVGLITDPHQAEAIVAEGRADLVALGRGLLNDPFWAWRAADALGGTVVPPDPYLRGRRMGADPPREIAAPKA